MNRMALLRPEAAAAAREDPGMYLAPSAWQGGGLLGCWEEWDLGVLPC